MHERIKIKLKLDILISNQSIIEKEIVKWKSVLREVNEMENEIDVLQKKFVGLAFDDPKRDKINDQIQLLINKQKDIYWNAESTAERIERRKLNFKTFEKTPKFKDGKYNFEFALMAYAEFIIEILDEKRKIWWDSLFSKSKDKFVNILKIELNSILGKRNQVTLRGEELISNMLIVLCKDAFQNRFTGEEWTNLEEFKRLFEQVYSVKRDHVYFF